MQKWKIRLLALLVLLGGFGIGWFVFDSETNDASRFPFRLGLDLSGGTHLVYRADTTSVPASEVADAMRSLREVIERRVNSQDLSGVAGVLDPVVQIEQTSGIGGDREHRLVVELPGITDVDEATRIIGATPLLEFKLVREDFGGPLSLEDESPNPEAYEDTGLTGRFVERAQLSFNSSQQGGLSNEPVVLLDFNTEGGDLFEKITTENVGRFLAIFLDGEVVSMPVIREPIPGGTATISGNFSPDEARELVRNLNFGALPTPITLVGSQTIGPSLGAATLMQGVQAGIAGLIAVALFMVAWYRLPGLIAVVSLAIYIAIVLALFKLIPVTLTAAAVAGFILSIGMAVDANVLIFERMKEELRAGGALLDAVRTGFSRAWPSIRDGNVSSLLTAVVIFYAGTFLTKGFAVTLAIGILASMISAITITRALLLVLGNVEAGKFARFLYGNGFSGTNFK